MSSRCGSIFSLAVNDFHFAFAIDDVSIGNLEQDSSSMA